MKPLYAFLILLVLPVSLFGQKMAGDYEPGLGVTYGLDMGDPGITGSLYYSFADEIRVGGDVTYFFASADEGTKNPKAFELNFNAHYHLMNQEVLRFYLLAGVQFAYIGYMVEADGQNVSESETGINLGGGVEWDLDGLTLFLEPKYTLGGFDQAVITFGARIFLY
ncbi:outer membrane beta-barrel protein [Balneolaceae bacterium ANBcel3]|nr:outer membrane beta-barrel protein [Balneolaceae bacterium ANBcel3]